MFFSTIYVECPFLVEQKRVYFMSYKTAIQTFRSLYKNATLVA